MVSIPEVVRDIIRNKPFIEEALGEGVINLSSLARKIKPEIETKIYKDVKLGAIVMALKRLAPTLNLKIDNRILKIFSNIGDITVRSNLTEHTYRNSASLFDKQKILFKEIGENNKDVFYTFSQGIFETTILSSQIVREKIDVLFTSEKLISKMDNLSSITVNLPADNILVSGVYYFFFKKFAWAGINVFDIISTAHEVTFVLNDQDINQAFFIIKSLKI